MTISFSDEYGLEEPIFRPIEVTEVTAVQEAPTLSGTYQEDWQPAVDEKSLTLETDTVMPIKPHYEATAKESTFIKAPTIEIETPSSSSASSSDDEDRETTSKETERVGPDEEIMDKGKESSSSESETEDKEMKVVKPDKIDTEKGKSSSSSSSSDEDDRDKHEAETKSLVEKEVKVEPIKHELLEGETDLDAVMLKTEAQIITTETVTLESVEVEEPEYDSNLDTVIRELKKIEKGELPELPPGYHLDDKQDSTLLETVVTSETSQIESSEIRPDVSKEPVEKSERGIVDKDLKEKLEEKSSSSSSSSDDEEFFEASSETPDRDKFPKFKTPEVTESVSVPDQSRISEISLEPNFIQAEPTEEFIIPPKVQEAGKSEPELTESEAGKKVEEAPKEDDTKHVHKKKVTFDVPDKETDSSSSESESENDTSDKEDEKSSSSDSGTEEQGGIHMHKEDSKLDKTDENKREDIQTTDLDADMEDTEPKLLSFTDSSEQQSLSFIETVSADRKDRIAVLEKSERADFKEKSESSNSSSESEDSENEPTSYNISKDSGHSSSDEESELSKKDKEHDKSDVVSDATEIRYKGTKVTEMIEVTQVSKQELVEGETDLDAVMLSPETKFISQEIQGEEEAEVDTILDTVIRELKKIEKGELPELPPGYGRDETIEISESSHLESTQYTLGSSVGGSDLSSRFETETDSVLMETPDKGLSDKDTEYVEIPKQSGKPLIETNIDELVEELEANVKGSVEKRTLSSSSSESDEQDKQIEGELMKPKLYKTPDIGTFDEKKVEEQDSEISIAEPIVVDDPDKFICIYPVPEVAPRAESPELIPISIVTEGVPDEKHRRSSTSSSSSSDHESSEQPIIIKEEKPWQCIYPIAPSTEITDQEPVPEFSAREPVEDIKEKVPSRKSSTSSSSSSDHDELETKVVVTEEKPWQCIYPIAPEMERESPEAPKQEPPPEVIEEKPWQCIYPITPSAELTEQPEFREEEPHEISVDDKPIVIKEEKPWQCIYPIAPNTETNEQPAFTEGEPDEKITEKMPSRKSSTSKSSSSDHEESDKEIKPVLTSTEKEPDSEKRDPEIKIDQPIVIEAEKPWQCIYPIAPEMKRESPEQPEQEPPPEVTEEKPWQCIYPIAPEMGSSERVDKEKDSSSSESDTEEKEVKGIESAKIEIEKEKTSSSSSSSDEEDQDNQETKTKVVVTEEKPWQCIYPIAPEMERESPEPPEQEPPPEVTEEKPWQCIYPIAPSAELTEQPEFREEEPHEISVDDKPIVIKEEKPWQGIYPIAPNAELTEQPEFREEEPHEISVDDKPIVIKEEKPWQCIYPIAPSTESTEQPEFTVGEPDKKITEKVPSRKSSTSSSSSSDEDEALPGIKPSLPSTEKETTRVESIIVHDKPPVIKKSDIPKASVKDDTEMKTSSSSSSSEDEDDAKDGKLKFTTTISARQAKGEPLVTDLDAKTAEPTEIKTEPKERGSSSSSSDDEAKIKPPVTDLDEDICKSDNPPDTVKEKTRSRSSSESSSSSSDDEKDRKPKFENSDDDVSVPKSLETDLDVDEPLPDTAKMKPKKEIETDIDAVEPEPVSFPDKADKPKSLPVSDVMETDLDAPDDDIVPEAEPVVESFEPLHSPDVEFAPKHYSDVPFETNVDTMEPEYTAYSIKSAIPVEAPESETKPPEDEVYCETSFTVVRRTKVKQSYASDKTDRQPTMVEEAIQQSGKTPAITDAPDTAGKRHRTESLSDEEEEEHPSKRQEFEPAEELVFGEDEAVPPAQEYILIEPTILHDKTEVRTEHYRKEMPYIPGDDASHTPDDTGILIA